MQLHQWFFSQFAPIDEQAVDLSTSSILATLATQISAIREYKILAESAEIEGAPNCTSEALQQQIAMLFNNDSYYAGVVAASEELQSQTMAFPDIPYTRREEPLTLERMLLPFTLQNINLTDLSRT